MIKESFYIKAIRFIEDNLNIPIAPKLHNIALYFSEKGKNKLAKFFLTPVLKAYPGDYDYLCLMFNIYHDLGMDEESYKVTQKLLEINPEDTLAHYNLAIDEKERGNIDKAIEHYKKVLEIEPNNVEALNNYGVIMKTKDLPHAIELYEKAISIEPLNKKANLNLADCYARIGNYYEAEKLYKKILVEYPDDEEATSDYMMTIYNHGDFDKARKMAESFIAKYPQYHRPYFYLALTYWQTNEISKAKEYFQKAIELGNPEAEDALSEMLEELKEDAQTP